MSTEFATISKTTTGVVTNVTNIHQAYEISKIGYEHNRVRVAFLRYGSFCTTNLYKEIQSIGEGWSVRVPANGDTNQALLVDANGVFRSWMIFSEIA